MEPIPTESSSLEKNSFPEIQLNKPIPEFTQDMYKSLVETMNEAIWVGDKNERTVYVNPKFCELLGYTFEEIIGKESYIFWDEGSANRVRYINNTDRRQGVASSYEGNLITKTGKNIPVLLNGTGIEGGGTIGIMTDMRLIKEKEKQQKIMGLAIELSSDAIIMFDPQHSITTWNSGAKQLLGYKKEEIIGKAIDLIFKYEDLDQVLSEGGMMYNVETSAKHKNGTSIETALTLTQVKKEGEVIQYLITARDISMQRKFEEETSKRFERMQNVYKEYGLLKRQMDYILEAISYFSEAHDQKSIADFFVSSSIMLSHVDACTLRKYDPESDQLELLSYFGVDAAWQGKANISLKGSICEKAFQNGGPIKIIDLMREPLYQSKAMAKRNNLASLLLIPLKFKGQICGSLSLYTSASKKLELLDNQFIREYAKVIELGIGTLWH
jgi:PAS domain S-box-containing protein